MYPTKRRIQKVALIYEYGVKELVKEVNCSKLAQTIARNSNRTTASMNAKIFSW